MLSSMHLSSEPACTSCCLSTTLRYTVLVTNTACHTAALHFQIYQQHLSAGLLPGLDSQKKYGMCFYSPLLRMPGPRDQPFVIWLLARSVMVWYVISHLLSLSMNHLNHLTDWHKTLTWAWIALRKSGWSLKTWSNASSIIEWEFISSYVNKGRCTATHTRCWHHLDHILHMLSYMQPMKAVIASNH